MPQVIHQHRLANGLRADTGAVCDAKGDALLLFDSGWRWDKDKKELHVKLRPNQAAALVVFTQPLPDASSPNMNGPQPNG